MEIVASKFIRSLVAGVIATSLTACGSGDSNNAPIFLSDYALTLTEDTQFSANITATDEDNNDTLTYTVSSAASKGVFELEANGAFIYTPSRNFFGKDSVTVQVSDGKATALTVVTFTVTNVNDAPVLQTTNIVVNSQGESTGTIEITDADNDAITFSVVMEPTLGTLVLDNTTGQFTYTPASLQQIDQSFTINYTDGNITAPIEAVIELQSAFTTNADKLNYYYASEQSHLKSAEALLTQSSDQQVKGVVTAEIAKGYYIAGFEEKGAELVDTIVQNNVKGEALRSIARVLDSANKTPLANQLRTSAESFFNQYLAEKGLANINANDANFYQNLINDYLDAGQSDLAENSLNAIKVYANAIKQDEYSTAYGRFVSAANAQVKDRIKHYLITFTESDRQKAEFAIDTMATFTQGIGYKASGGLPAYRTRAFYLSYVANYYYLIKAVEKAKEYTAKTLSYFSDANYDANYTYPADGYAAATYNSSLTPVETIAGLIEGLYPALGTNPALSIITPITSRDYQDAQEQIFAYKIVNNLLAGDTVEQASQAAFDYFVTEKNDIRSFYEVLVEQNLGERGGKAAINLIRLQKDDLAVDVIKYAFDNALNTAKYIENNTGNSLDRYITGDWGCHRVISLLDKLAQDVTPYQTACKTIADNKLTTQSGLVSTLIAQEVQMNLISSYAITNDSVAMLSVANKSSDEAALLTTDPLAQVTSHLEIASALASYGLIVEAGDYLTMALIQSNKLLNETIINQELITNLAKALTKYAVDDDEQISNNGYAIYPLESALRRQAGKHVNYATEMTKQLGALQSTISLLTAKTLTLSVNEQQGLLADLIKLNANAGLYNQANALVNNEINTSADIMAYAATLAEIIATQDDFPASDIAFIDTDTDGMPNFFLLSATDEQITASGLIADTDSDGDSIADEQDSLPLIAN